tara:strand:- start:5827 stop:6162 length:336 start_codon:yes stop_codon:yes gene_type:complete
MNYNKYKNIWNKDLNLLDLTINDFIAKGCKPLGGVSIIAGDKNIIYIQTITVDNDSNNVLGEFHSEPLYLREVRELASSGNKLAAVKLLKDETDMGLQEAKEWVDNNCTIS